MKKIKYVIIMFLFIFSLSSCIFKNDKIDYDIITQEVDENTDIKTLKRKYDNLLLYKEELQAELNELRTDYDTISEEIEALEQRIQDNIAEIDYIIEKNYSAFMTLENNIIKASVYIRYFENKDTKTYSGGSGFIIDSDNNYYYLMTNNHVVYSEYETSTYHVDVFDYLNNKYTGEILFRQKEYDMAFVKIKKGITALNIVPLANENPTKGDIVFAIGNPLNQRNSIASGYVNGYLKTKLKTESSAITYEMVNHNAFELEGSSGGMLINDKYEVVGINTIGSSTNSYTYSYCLSSPVLKIKEFLNTNGYEVM